MLSEIQAACLGDALRKLLGTPQEGTMAFIRCIPPEAMSELFQDSEFQIDGWSVFLVSDVSDEQRRTITADQAVDLREEKRGSVLLFVDTKRAGAGMDGIYSAVREITEGELLHRAIKAAERRFESKQQKQFTDWAVKQAKKLGRTNTVSPWREFEFYARCAAGPDLIGGHIGILGLWPIATNEGLHKEDLALSAQVVERILLPSGAANTPAARVQSLLLPADDVALSEGLERFLRDSSSLRWTEAAERAIDFPDFWLNRLRPGLNSQELISIEITEWQNRPDAAPLKWSGLTLSDSYEVQFLINDTSKLEVRWKTQPPNLKGGAVEYIVSIVTGSDVELVSRQVSHTDKKEQKCIFTAEDFADFDGTEKWEAKITVHPIDEPSPLEIYGETQSARWKETREFILTFGASKSTTKTSVGKKTRALVEEAIRLDVESFEVACSQSRNEDSQHFVSFSVGGKSGRVYRPELVKAVEEKWGESNYAIGRWVVQVRTDGSRVGEPRFVPCERGAYPADAWKKLEDATRQLGQKALAQNGFVGLIYHNHEHAANYVNAWATAIEVGTAELAIANTVEVQNLDGTRIGLIVLPSHPARVAWHSAYDELAYHARFAEELSPSETINLLKSLDGSFVPMFLPGIADDKPFVFGDSLGFHATAMIQVNEPEPQALIAQMMRCMSSTPSDDIAPTVGSSTATAIGREIEKYNSLHSAYRTIHINALRAGDGKTIAQALGVSVDRGADDEETEGYRPDERAFVLNLYPSEESSNSRLVGRYFADAAERRRSGVSAGESNDRWMLESFEVGNVTLPRLKWAKRDNSEPDTAAHVSIAFDIFDSQVETTSIKDIREARPTEAYGLIPSMVRQFSPEPIPTWTMSLAPQVDGEKHPFVAVLSQRLHRVHSAVMKSTASSISTGSEKVDGDWIVLRTSLRANQLDFIRKMHDLSDWVVSVDRNAGIEYFDAPKSANEVYETYVIDCVPERQDLETLQLVTSTTKIDEVLRLLENSLGDMALSRSPRNGRFLLTNLKALSGRLAMRLTEKGHGRTEMIALAMFHAGCQRFAGANDWLSLEKGFLVPLDDVRDLLPSTPVEKSAAQTVEVEEPESSLMRADLVYVSLSRRGSLQFTFVEIKYRRLLNSARDPNLHDHMAGQVTNTRRRWMETYFASKLTQTQLVMRRKKLARALRFYLDKAERHMLLGAEYKRLSGAIDKLFRSDTDISEDAISDRGYVFCPEHRGGIELIAELPDADIRIFGAESLPDLPYELTAPSTPQTSAEPSIEQSVAPPPEKGGEEPTTVAAVTADEVATVLTSDGAEDVTEVQTSLPQQSQNEPAELPSTRPDGISIRLGNTLSSDTPVDWKVSISGNPHMLIAGLPGMGKTTSLINICDQLVHGQITPIVFSYHDDIETKLGERLGQLEFVDIDSGLAFNPLQVVTQNAHAWLDNIGKLRDIFSAIYPDLGEIQLNEVRESIKQSYVDVGYGAADSVEGLPTPRFSRFYELLRGKPKPNHGVIARLDELNDYGFFNTNAERGSILELQKPVIVRLHTTQNEVLQNAMASFVLLNLYQNMLRRGSQPNLTHAVIFDEAHRAAKLKLLPTMAKESRKFGLSMIVASQEAKDFSDSLYAAIANYLVLRVTEVDAKTLAKNVVHSAEANSIAGKLKSLDKYTGMFFTEGRRPITLKLLA